MTHLGVRYYIWSKNNNSKWISQTKSINSFMIITFVKQRHIYMLVSDRPRGSKITLRGLLQGGTLIFSSCVGSGSESTVHPPKYQYIQALQKYLKF